ncbi:neutrophil cytosol factor 2 [Nelusetta ayraudi]|uniref:neutrophil cytosol factor 2 n=1 Tax=Nelusetta ayraudi TaxID=303726 RepID=UPI003F6F19BD
MSFLETLRQWDEATTCADGEDFTEALRIFLSIQEPNSKILFNIGSLHLLGQDLDAAEKAFDFSICKDEHLAVAFFQRGLTFYKMRRFEESLADFQHAFKTLRGNQLIDYKALGLRYKLYACEVLHNAALVEAELGNWEKAQQNLVKALDLRTDAKLGLIDRALESTLRQKLFKIVEFPTKTLFKPNKNYVAELEKKDYLGKAKLLASVVPQDEFIGFAPLQPQVESSPTDPKEPEVLRALEGEPHTVLFEFIPETSGELAVVPGNIVFVLQKGKDNWASVVFNERRGLVPYNYLERLEISLSSKQNIGTSNPPSRKPPARPERNQDLTRSDSKGEEPQLKPADGNYVVKVRYTFNFAFLVPGGSSYATLIDKISEKIKVAPSAVTLSLTAEVTDQSELSADTDMESVWSSATDGRITLWCNTKEPSGVQLNEIQLVALHTYDSANPEDLTFREGDTITFLSRVNRDWLEGRFNGNTGIFPATFVDDAKISRQ